MQWGVYITFLIGTAHVNLVDGVDVPRERLHYVMQSPTGSQFCNDLVTILRSPEELLNKVITRKPRYLL